jgi:hypothetical protein
LVAGRGRTAAGRVWVLVPEVRNLDRLGVMAAMWALSGDEVRARILSAVRLVAGGTHRLTRLEHATLELFALAAVR